MAGHPAPAVTRWRGSKLVDDKYVLSPLDVVCTKLVIKKLQRSDLPRQVHLPGVQDLTLPRSSSFTINMNQAQNLVHGVSLDEQAEISCEVNVDPCELWFNWSLNDSVEVFDVKTCTVNGTTSVASYRLRWKHCYGLLYCWATNTRGSPAYSPSYRQLSA
ncbi:hypothetical protein MTO96_005586 [Rhipicephalus appendiculatus]